MSGTLCHETSSRHRALGRRGATFPAGLYPSAVAASARDDVRSTIRTAFFASGAVFAFLMWQLYLRAAPSDVPEWTAAIPRINAGFNATTTLLVCLGVAAIRTGRRRLHAALQIAGLISGSLFLTGYITYHHYHGDTPYPGTGFLRPIYFSILITHILASAAAVPLVVSTALLAARRRFSHHRRWARVAVPVWLTASVTGLIVYFMLYG